ncbi:exodeoxyribonuclease V subunit gamma [Desulfobulbus alkaliphilus]|uniref:exodeoxyribonuclease V subunit gamma n=1 Tax=Desulfobulbus alkaliphilus TaxID=869814 RepID=UPI001966C35F|nr:exodeoxyribonuclease V subunit gamma [Desulfobulbus alkaliphilus]MBM9535941.1 exodeoxyribonuclease V subunit gamma [Desulfobulbus alkaliphilus]
MGTQNKNTGQDLSPGLAIIHSNRLEDLRQVAVGWIKAHPLQVLESEQFIVQSNGMAQWLKLALAADDGCGISAGIDMQLPGHFVWSAYRAVLGSDSIPAESPYDKERLMWRIFRLLPGLCAERLFDPLRRFLDHDTDQRKRGQLAAHLADLYDQYQVYRADWLEDWAQGVDRLTRIAKEPEPLGEDQLWQAELWRRIKADVREEDRNLSRSDLHHRFVEKARTLQGRPRELSPRTIVFGISSLPRQVLETLHAVSSLCQVLLFVHNPCRHFWADIIEDRELLRIEHARHKAKATMPEPLDPALLHQHANPLLAAWGKQGRDYIGLLYGYDQPENYATAFTQIDLFADFLVAGSDHSLLRQVQQAVLDLEPLAKDEAAKPAVGPEDQSICFHLAHSRQREVEILQDQLLHCFETLEDLKPRDIIVMTPDIESYAPHIEAVFGNLSLTDPRFIPFTIADKPNRESVPLLKALETLLHLPDSRMGVSVVLDLLEVGAFRKRFQIEAADIPRLKQWIEGAGISWGLHGEQRTFFELPEGLEQNTWSFGLDRMLLGYAVGQGAAWIGIEPYEEVGGLDAALAGLLFDVIRQLDSLWRELNQTGTPTAWCRRIRKLVQDCFLAQDSQDHLTLSRLDQVLDQWQDACDQAMLDEALTLAVVRAFLLARMKESSISQRFLAGMVNFGTLMPMRAIPFRVVCLLGMNDGDFPRSRPPLDFDLMAGNGLYRPGDRSRREDDRYLFLEALLSARERLYISYVGRDDRDNSERMPSVLVGQLRDYLAAGWCLQKEGTGNGDLLAALTRTYPLQPFAKAYFLDNRSDLFTYAHEWRTSLDIDNNHQSTASIHQLLDPPDLTEGLNLGSLVRFYTQPVRYFFNQRLSVRFDDLSATSQDQEPFALDNLAPFRLGNQLLEAGLHAGQADAPAAVEAEALRLIRAGALPMAGFGHLAAQKLMESVLDMLQGHQVLLDQWPCPCDPMEIAQPIAPEDMPSVALDDWLDKVHEVNAPDATGECTDSVRFARWEFYSLPIMDNNTGKIIRLHSLAGLWVKHVAGCAQGIRLASHLVAPGGTVSLAPMGQSLARHILTDMVVCLCSGLRWPLPVTAKTGLAYTHALLSQDEDRAKATASRVYEGDGFNSGGELAHDPCLQRAYPTFTDLWQARDNHFAALCQILYTPLLQALEKEE